MICLSTSRPQIGELERDQWLWPMNKALDEGGFDLAVVKYLKSYFAEAADFLRDKVDD